MLNGDSSGCPQVSSNTKTVLLSHGYGLLSAEREFWADFTVAEVDLNRLSPNSPFFTIGPSHYKFLAISCIAMGQREAGLHRNPNYVPGYPSTLPWLKSLAMWSLTTAFGVFTFWFMVWVVPEDTAWWSYYFVTSRCWWYSGAVICKLFTDLFGRPMKGMALFLGKFIPIHTHKIFHVIPKLNQWLPPVGINVPQF